MKETHNTSSKGWSRIRSWKYNSPGLREGAGCPWTAFQHVSCWCCALVLQQRRRRRGEEQQAAKDRRKRRSRRGWRMMLHDAVLHWTPWLFGSNMNPSKCDRIHGLSLAFDCIDCMVHNSNLISRSRSQTQVLLFYWRTQRWENKKYRTTVSAGR